MPCHTDPLGYFFIKDFDKFDITPNKFVFKPLSYCFYVLNFDIYAFNVHIMSKMIKGRF